MHFKIKHFSKIHSSRRNVVIPCWDVIVAIGYHSLSRRDGHPMLGCDNGNSYWMMSQR